MPLVCWRESSCSAWSTVTAPLSSCELVALSWSMPAVSFERFPWASAMDLSRFSGSAPPAAAMALASARPFSTAARLAWSSWSFAGAPAAVVPRAAKADSAAASWGPSASICCCTIAYSSLSGSRPESWALSASSCADRAVYPAMPSCNPLMAWSNEASWLLSWERVVCKVFSLLTASSSCFLFCSMVPSWADIWALADSISTFLEMSCPWAAPVCWASWAWPSSSWAFCPSSSSCCSLVSLRPSSISFELSSRSFWASPNFSSSFALSFRFSASILSWRSSTITLSCTLPLAETLATPSMPSSFSISSESSRSVSSTLSMPSISMAATVTGIMLGFIFMI